MPSKKFKIESKYENVVVLSTSIRTFCLEHSIKHEKIMEIELCLIEALNNVIKHSYESKENNQIEIDIIIETDTIDIYIHDYGIARTNFERPTLEFDPEDIENLPEGGMGLFIIDNLMHETKYTSENGKNTFLMRAKI
ncbi:MAG: ATP-binding protein [Ignavibacteria bacterium]|jgi:serine/threonine-protein kinase RsbW